MHLVRLLHPTTSTARFLKLPLLYRTNSRAISRTCCSIGEMAMESLISSKSAELRLCNVSSHTSELLEVRADDPKMHVLFIPGNPGIVTYYTDFLESLYELLGGTVSVTAIGHISQSRKDWENGRLFSFQDQIDHKVNFIRQEMLNCEVPILLVGHSIGSYISLEMLKRSPEKFAYCIGLYPFLTLNPNSKTQSLIKRVASSSIMRAAISTLAASLALLPTSVSQFTVASSVGRSWSRTAIEATCTHLLQYHTVQSVLFMAMTEFERLSEEPDWEFMKANDSKIAFLFGSDDHWGPLETLEEISRRVPRIGLSIEREGHTHAFSCTEEGSAWVAKHVVGLIKNRVFTLKT